MRLFVLVALTMVAFAANSVLNRMALAGGQIGPGGFAAIRLVAGGLALLALVRWQEGRVALGEAFRPAGAVTLLIYVLGFSYAYLTLDAGVGALILFGGVQITMFAGALIGGERPPARRWLGAAVAFGGLCWLLWPGGRTAPDLGGAVLMVAAAVGWGLFSLIGRGVRRPTAATAAAFVMAAPIAIVVLVVHPDGQAVTGFGVQLAVVSGVLTSGLGYALWYAVLPRLAVSTAAVAQLTVPILAMAGGNVVLSEPVTARFVIAAALVLGGVALSLIVTRAPAPKGE